MGGLYRHIRACDSWLKSVRGKGLAVEVDGNPATTENRLQATLAEVDGGVIPKAGRGDLRGRCQL